MKAFHPARWLLGLCPLAVFGACTVESPPAEPGPMGGSGGSSSVIPGGGSAGAATAGSTSGGVSSAAGATSTAGTAMGGAQPVGGSAPTAGTTSAGSGGGGAGGGSGQPGGPTAGCGKTSDDEPNTDVLHNLTVGGQARRYWTKLPQTYDGTTPMPLVFYGPGCGASGVEGAPLDGSIRDKAIRVFVIGTGSCFSTGEAEPETGYFNAVLDEVQANYCTDKGKVFVSGYSSGGWLSMLLACTAGDRITAIGAAAGGFRASKFGPMCKGNPAAMFHAGTGDTANPITRLDDQGNNYGSSAGRDNLLMRNGCTMETKVWDPMYPACKEYIGCSSPVIWCEENVGHSNGEEVARTGWWKFWSGL